MAPSISAASNSTIVRQESGRSGSTVSRQESGRPGLNLPSPSSFRASASYTSGSRLSANIARPDDVSLASMTQKRKKQLVKEGDQIVRGNKDVGGLAGETADSKKADFDAKSRLLRTPTGETSIAGKEEALEEIMCAEAYAGFERMARHQLNKAQSTRNGIDPDRIPGMDVDEMSSYYITNNEPEAPLSDSDDELVGMARFEDFNFAVCDDYHRDHPSWGLQFGFGFGDAPDKKFLPQDRVFFAHCAHLTIMGVAAGHGSNKISFELAKFIANELPRAIIKSPWLTQESDPVNSLVHAFDRVHRKALRELDCRLTGASVTALLIDTDHVWVAHVGDCRAVLGTPDASENSETYHFTSVPITEDHKLSVKAEFNRILDSGGEVRRLVNDNTHRLFFKEDYLPGLTVTRSIGHRMAHVCGVDHYPTVNCLSRASLHKDAFILVASGGVWHTMSERGIVNWVGKFFHSSHEAAESLSQEASRRWEEPETRAKACLRSDERDCFASLVFYPTQETVGQRSRALPLEDKSPLSPRRFLMAPHGEPVARRSWKDAKVVNWKEELRKTLSGDRELERLRDSHDLAF